ncbi:threonine-phosphate decarboxylase [Caldalkalibacillus uzonensis]|uniref:threonine-phosphate decarboxylase n=1 Tax=Caldalkalibacillus uzonensis TaxID=353224 RepID=A0ABU0CPM4_9BACI|nr:threonine-phosphate decarboxylase CobD [Caldalkalibacillus uzonensis]MDQ0338339.1 threonine-phosphate decarboxylase [Caldalkalibacillus uzonensis]
MQWPSHGGQPEQMWNMFHQSRPQSVLDFSANLNPLGPPDYIQELIFSALKQIRRYPDPNYEEPRQAIAQAEGLPSEKVLLTNGGAEAIFLVAHWLRNKRALIVHPTFGEYERACQQHGLQITPLFLSHPPRFEWPLGEIVAHLSDVDVIFLAQPNNPTGTLLDADTIRSILSAARRHGCYVVVDEAFVDFLPQADSLTPWLKEAPHLILLRSLTKMFTIPGLRLGYILADEAVIEELAAKQMPWSVNALAAALIPHLVADQTFVARTRDWLLAETQFLRTALTGLKFETSPFTANFYLLRDGRSERWSKEQAVSEAEALLAFLLGKGIVPRHTHTFKGLDGEWLRFAVRSREENEKLVAALAEWTEQRW